MHPDLQIADFKAEYAGDFERLNREWLERSFRVEDIDRRILAAPEAQIIKHGGHILFASIGGEVVGTVALKHHGEGLFELTKMAVTLAWQGNGIGRALLGAAIARFERVAGEKLYLESHSSLTAAIGLYQSAGFVHARHPGASDYARSDTYMVYERA